MAIPRLDPTVCAICGPGVSDAEFCSAKLNVQAFSPYVFSARRTPDGLHYRMVKCNRCGLIRANPMASEEEEARLYRASSVFYQQETSNLVRTYGRCVARLQQIGHYGRALLEVGCGNGFFLVEARRQGYTTVCGVEPSANAVRDADDSIRENIVCDAMKPGLFNAEMFDTICMFQVFDHMREPGMILDECLRVLKPGGIFLCLNHNSNSLSVRLQGANSPIFDLAHPYLYDKRTMSSLLEKHGFKAVACRTVFNRYSLHYLIRLSPLSMSVKRAMLKFLSLSHLNGLSLSLPIGNMCVEAHKPCATVTKSTGRRTVEQ